MNKKFDKKNYWDIHITYPQTTYVLLLLGDIRDIHG